MAYPYGPYSYPGWYQTYYYYPPPPGTPFVPNLTLYNSSPWARHSPLPPVSPYLPAPTSAPAGVHFPTGGDGGSGKYSGDYVSLGNVATPMRERRPSLNNSAWPGGLTADTGHVRRHSFNAGTLKAPTHYTADHKQLYINPWINAESPRFDFDFDLSKTSFSPLRLYGGGHALELPREELEQPATYPSIYKLRIISDEIPQWPIELSFEAYPASSGLFSPPASSYPNPQHPIHLADILIAIHQSLHQPIRQTDYDALNSREKEAVGQAYRARCSAAGSYYEQEAERARGIKRVDFFGKKKKLVGLTRLAPYMDWENMKMHTR